MRIIKVIYNKETEDVLDLLKDIKSIIVEKYNYDHYKERKNAIPIMTRHGAKKFPFLVFENENLIEYSAYWSESKKILNLELIMEYINMECIDKEFI